MKEKPGYTPRPPVSSGARDRIGIIWDGSVLGQSIGGDPVPFREPQAQCKSQPHPLLAPQLNPERKEPLPDAILRALLRYSINRVPE
jgi:hypothetical protein